MRLGVEGEGSVWKDDIDFTSSSSGLVSMTASRRLSM